MRRFSSTWVTTLCVLAATVVAIRVSRGQQAAGTPVPGAVTPRAELYSLDDAFLRWPLPAGESRYSAIDGKHMHGYVVEQAAISRRYRDQGHPKFWGRIIGTSSDKESADREDHR